MDIVRSGTALRLHPRLRQVFIELPNMINPDVQNSSAPHWDHIIINISEPQRVLAEEFATQVKVHNDNCCPIIRILSCSIGQPLAQGSCKSLKYGAPGEIRTPDRLVRRGNHLFLIII